MSTFDEIAELVGLGEGNERWGVQPVRTNQGLIDAVREVVEERDRLLKFKEYVHGRLTKMNVPQDPESEKTAEHGCRVEGRLNWVEKELEYGPS